MPNASPSAPYRVLARKYRPQTFGALIGQEALVRTLSNAIDTGRIAQAFILTGVRGVGKTTTARIIARALNCVGPSGAGGPTISPCGVCEPCRAIAEDRHVDVIEIDAASHTGVDNVREIIESVRYQPALARYKIYIIDEVHMLSKPAFNALLKTLEEPPAHTKFVFATTEIRKVPVTVLSRCQRFDLRRIDTGELVGHFTRIAGEEGVALADDAAAMLARAADGSVRDGLSMLDQAIALADDGSGGAIEIGPQLVREMLGLADRSQIFDLFEAVIEGRIAAALALFETMHRAGADALTVAQDLLELTHLASRIKAAGLAGDDAPDPHRFGELERTRGRALAARASVPVLARLWQMLLRGVDEIQRAADGGAALDMILIRIAHVADLPPPGELARLIQAAEPGERGAAPPAALRASVTTPTPPEPPATQPAVRALAPQAMAMAMSARGAAAAVVASPARPPAIASPAAAPVTAVPVTAVPVTAVPVAAVPVAPPDPQSFAEVVALFGARREGVWRTQLSLNVHLVHFEPGRIEIRPTEQAPRDLANRVGDLLSSWTGRRWIVIVSGGPGAPTLRDQAEHAAADRLQAARDHPAVQAYLAAFPGAQLRAARPHGAAPPIAAPSAFGEAPDRDGASDPDERAGEERLDDPFAFDDYDPDDARSPDSAA